MKAILLDRDGTFVFEPPADDGAVRIADLRLLPHAIRGMTAMQDAGYALFVISNQNAIDEGLITAKEYDEMNLILTAQLHGIHILAWEMCPHTEGAGCACRKPRRGMVDALLARFPIDLGKSWLIGDRSTDVELARACGMGSVLVKRNEEFFVPMTLEPDVRASNLLDAIGQIRARDA